MSEEHVFALLLCRHSNAAAVSSFVWASAQISSVIKRSVSKKRQINDKSTLLEIKYIIALPQKLVGGISKKKQMDLASDNPPGHFLFVEDKSKNLSKPQNEYNWFFTILSNFFLYQRRLSRRFRPAGRLWVILWIILTSM